MTKIFLCIAICMAVSFSFVYGQPFAGAKWITTGYDEGAGPRACPVFVRKIVAARAVASARLVITALGLYEARLNDEKMGAAYFTPGYTSYDKRLQYQVYDVRLHEGENRLVITVADGWYRGVFGGAMARDNYGSKAGLLCRLDITYQDGTSDSAVSDGGWQCGTGLRRYADFYQGEVQDTRLGLAENLQPVAMLPTPTARLVPGEGPPVLAHDQGGAKRTWIGPKQELLMDFGQNRAGWVKATVHGHAGDTVRIAYAEMLDSAGNFYTGNLREAKATDCFVLNGHEQVLEPSFTYHGFRYIRIEGIAHAAVSAVACYSEVRPAGTFTCSDTMVNRLVSNIGWSLRSNFVDIPTDCPQRSERLGWTGDAQVFCRTAAYFTDCKAFFRKYCRDLAADQGVNGGVPNIIPDIYRHRDSVKGGVAGWGDAATMIPWTLYMMYGDTAVLREQYPSMRAWVNYVQGQSPDGLWRAPGYGDWYALGDSTSKPYIDQCFYARSAWILSQTARVLGLHYDFEDYTRLYDKVRERFLTTYIFKEPANTRTQTACLLALAFDLLPDSLQPRMLEVLARRISENRSHLATGFLGTPYLLPVLSRFGYVYLSYQLLMENTCPSWLYPVTMGATTIWERWDAIRPNGSMQATSYNHYSYGAVGQWLFESVAGIRPGSPGFDTIRIAPLPGRLLEWVKCSYECKYGTIRSEWRRKGRRVKYRIGIPAGAKAVIALPGRKERMVGEGIYSFSVKE